MLVKHKIRRQKYSLKTSVGQIVSIIQHVLCCLSLTTLSGWLIKTPEVHRHQLAYTRLLHSHPIYHIYSSHRLLVVGHYYKL